MSNGSFIIPAMSDYYYGTIGKNDAMAEWGQSGIALIVRTVG
jgi:hypothetical protein